MKAFGFLSIVSLLFLFSCGESTQTVEKPTEEKGVSLQLATERKARVSAINYQLKFDIPSQKKAPIAGNLIVSFTLGNIDKSLSLDFKEDTEHLKKVLLDGKPIEVQFANDHIVISPENLKVGNNQFEIIFTAGDLSLNRNDDFLYTLLVPDRARTLFPVFDQPNLKATYELNLTVPLEWEAVANGKNISQKEENGRKTVFFEKTKEISSYLFAFATGVFEKVTDPESGMTMYHREKDQEKVDRNAPEIFSLHRKSVEWMEAYTGQEYPYSKFDFVLIPPFQYGGMEHPGSVFYRESTLFLDEGASINQQLRRASLIGHETAHMWFGNLVTMDWFNDVWLKEVFANQMASKIMHPGFPEINHDLNFLLSYYPRALDVDRSEGTHPIQQELNNLQNAGTLYGNIIYNKAPIVMRNLEYLMGEEQFKKALQEYISEFSGGNATWDDLIAIMKRHTDKNLDQWNKDWVKGKGVPVYETEFDVEGMQLVFHQQQQINNQIWPQEVSYRPLIDRQKETSIYLDKNEVSVTYGQLQDITLVNINGKGYGYFKLSQEQWEILLPVAGNAEDEIERGAFWMNTWEAVLNEDLYPGKVFYEISKTIATEKNPLILSYKLGRLSDIFWLMMDDIEREEASNFVEGVLTETIKLEKDPSLKRLLFNNLVSIAYSENGGVILYDIWKAKGDNIGLKLSENELVNLAFNISLREVEGAQEILISQLENLKNEDRKKKMSFIIPALSSDLLVRDQFFASLSNPENRGSEPWVVDALSFLHHPLRQETSAKYILPSLNMIEEIQETGDIFFPARWLNNTLGSYSKEEVADEVRRFLDENPDLSEKLRNKILQAADMTFRSSQIMVNQQSLNLNR